MYARPYTHRYPGASPSRAGVTAFRTGHGVVILYLILKNIKNTRSFQSALPQKYVFSFLVWGRSLPFTPWGNGQSAFALPVFSPARSCVFKQIRDILSAFAGQCALCFLLNPRSFCETHTLFSLPCGPFGAACRLHVYGRKTRRAYGTGPHP